MVAAERPNKRYAMRRLNQPSPSTSKPRGRRFNAVITAEWTIQQFRETLPFDHPIPVPDTRAGLDVFAQVDQMLKSSGHGC